MRQIISASRRTDMPACHFDTLRRFIEQGRADVPNPYSGAVHPVDLRPESVHTLVLWSKDFANVLAAPGLFEPYHLYFLFTINDLPRLEPHVPPLESRLNQIRELAMRFGPERIGWRFDPVVFTSDGPLSTPESFRRIGEVIAGAGIKRVIFSFLDMYGKVRERNERFNLDLIDPSVDVKRDYAAGLAVIAAELGLRLESCCDDLDVPGISHSSCIDGVLLAQLAGEPVTLSRDTGQRVACRCTKSRDIGSYREMPCGHGCLYCYANPVIAISGGYRYCDCS